LTEGRSARRLPRRERRIWYGLAAAWLGVVIGVSSARDLSATFVGYAIVFAAALAFSVQQRLAALRRPVRPLGRWGRRVAFGLPVVVLGVAAAFWIAYGPTMALGYGLGSGLAMGVIYCFQLIPAMKAGSS
jgi:hypothetical protein